MKKLLVILALCMVLSVVLVACETPETPENPTDNVTTQKPTEAPTTNEPTTNEPTTNEPTTNEPTTNEPTTDEPTTDEPTTDEPTTEPPVVDPDPVTTHISFDQFCLVLDGAETDVFAPGQSSSWDKTANIEDYHVQYIKIWGWAAFYGEAVGEFGYQINDEEPVFSADFAVEAGADVVAAAGGKPVSRFAIMVPVRELSGEFTVKGLVRDAVGTVEEICVATITKAVDPDAPTFVIDATTISTTATGAPDVANVALSEDASFVTLTNGTVGDPYVTFRNLGVSARYVAVKYRTTVAGSSYNFFAGSTGTDADGKGDQLGEQTYTADGMWHVTITDLDPAEKVNETWDLSFVRYDFYTRGTDQSIDIAYIAGFNSIEAAEAYFAKTMLVADNTNTFASDVNANEVGTDLGVSDLSNFFTLNLPTGGHLVEAYGEGKVYSMDNINEMLADVNGAYYVSVNILSGAVPSSVFVRGYHVVNSDAIIEAFDPNAGLYKINNYYETDGGTWCGGAGIYATITNGNLFIVLKAYDANVTTRVSNPAWMIPCEGTTLTIADNGYTVSLMVDGVTYATIDLIGAQSYADINDVSPAGQFAAKAIVTLKDGTTQTIENTLVAATVNSQVGVVARSGGTKFDSIVVGGYSAIEVPALEIVEPEPVDPNAPIFVATPEILANATTTGNQSTAVISEDGKFVTITAGEGSPVDANFWVLSPGSMITGVKYVGLKYRTTVNPGGEFFVGSANITGGADEYKFQYVADGEWQVLILDITSFVNADGLVNYMRFDYFMAESVGCSIDIENIALFNSLESANKFYGIETPEEPEEPVVENYIVPMDQWAVTGHAAGLTDTSSPDKGPMIAAGGIEKGALLHQGYIGLGEIDLSKYSKVIISYGIDNSPVTVGHYDANFANRILLCKADAAMTNSPTEDNIIASTTYTLEGWKLVTIEIDLTNVDYNGPVFVTYDTLPGTFMLIGQIEFVYGEEEAPVEPEEPTVEPLTIDLSDKSFSLPNWEAAGYTAPIIKLGYDNISALGTLNLTAYNTITIKYSYDGDNTREGRTPEQCFTDSSHTPIIGLTAIEKCFGYANVVNQEAIENGVYAEMEYTPGCWAGATRTAVIDISGLEFEAPCYLSVFNPWGTEVVISEIVLS